VKLMLKHQLELVQSFLHCRSW